mmetsp:Transcript_82139/g.266189  ORF Transcript_82139/g.266189 Transcript_82139/m.266189 type:complete len:222 (-) Transcript_82139:261-926(-)
MCLIENDVAHARKCLGLRREPAQQVARRHEGELAAGQGLAADPVADLLADLFTTLLSNTSCKRNCCHAPWLSHDDAGNMARCCSLLEDVLGHLSGFPATRPANNDSNALSFDSTPDVVALLSHRQGISLKCLRYVPRLCVPQALAKRPGRAGCHLQRLLRFPQQLPGARRDGGALCLSRLRPQPFRGGQGRQLRRRRRRHPKRPVPAGPLQQRPASASCDA